MRVMTGKDHENNIVTMTKRTYHLYPIYTIEQYNNYTTTMPLLWVVSPNKAEKPVRRPVVINQFVIVGRINLFEFNSDITVSAHISDHRPITTAVIRI